MMLTFCSSAYRNSTIIHEDDEMLKKYFLLKRKTITSKRLLAPWLCNDIMVCIHKKHKWHKMAKQGLISFCSYKKYCTLLRKLLTLAEKDYFLKKLNSLGTDPKKIGPF